jgi:hypothetical protein
MEKVLGRDFFINCMGAALAYLFCFFLLTPLSGPDAPQSFFKFLGILLLITLSIGSLFGWGLLLRNKFFRNCELPIAAALGALFLGFFLLLTGTLQLIGAKFFPIFLLLHLLGVSFALLFFKRSGKKNFPFNALYLLPLLFLPLLALVPQDHPDPLYYHVLAPRNWFHEGGIRLLPQHPLLFLSGIWDILYLWPIAWLPLTPGQELYAQLLAAQSLHFWIAFLGSAAILWILSATLFFSLRIVFLGFSLANYWLLPVAFVAKNDWGLILFFLSGVLLLRQEQKKMDFWAGIFFGLAIMVKLSSASLFACFFLVYARRLFSLPLLAGVAAGMLPILARNFFFTPSPIFPIDAEAVLSQSDQIMIQAYSSAWREFSFTLLTQRLGQIFSMLPLGWVFLLLPFFWKKFHEKEKIFLRKALLAVALATVLGSVLLHSSLSWRVNLPLPLFWSLLSAWILCLILQRLPDFFTKSASVFASIALLYFIAPALPLLRGIFTEPALQVRNFPAGDAMAYVRLQELQGKIAVGGNPQLYFLSHLPAHTVETNPSLDALSWSAKLPSEFVRSLQKNGYRYFIETAGAIPWGRSSGLMAKIVEKFPEAVVFRGEQGRVVDVGLLLKLIEAKPFSEPAYERHEIRFEQQK